MLTPAASSSSRAAVRSISSYAPCSANNAAAARNTLAFATRYPAPVNSRRALSFNSHHFQQFPRLQSLSTVSNKRAFGTTVKMVGNRPGSGQTSFARSVILVCFKGHD